MASFVISGLFLLLLWVSLGSPHLSHDGRLKTGDQLNVIKISFAVAAGSGGVIALVIAYRRQRITEEDNERAREVHLREERRLLNERFATATAQLGHEKSAVRLAGVYAVASLADDWNEQQQTCIDVLCAYVRMPYRQNDESADRYVEEKQVRDTIMRVISRHLLQEPGWRGCTFDFSGATMDGFQLSGITVDRGTVIDFNRARFIEGRNMIQRLRLIEGTISFWDCEVLGGGIEIYASDLSGGTLWFRNAKIKGGVVSFEGVSYGGPGGEESSVHRTSISGTRIDFGDSEVCGGSLRFDQSDFSGGKVWFQGCKFTSGSVSFEKAAFLGGVVNFDGAMFTGAEVAFRQSGISPEVVDLRNCSSYEVPPRIDAGDISSRENAVNLFNGGVAPNVP
ncbi:hypothetical protein ACWGKW_32405 [Streptomyces sp. NPDC054766]